MGNIKIKESDSMISDTLATGAGSEVDPKVPHFAMYDPASGLTARIEKTDWNKEVLPIHEEHVHQFEFNTHMARSLTTSTTLTVAAPASSYQVTVASVAGLAVGNKIQLRTTTYREFDYLRIQAINGLVIDLDRRIDQAYPIGSIIERFSLDLNVAGTLAAPISYKYYPRPGKVQHLENLIVYIRSALQPYDSYFGGIAGLTNGVHFRKYNGATATYTGLDVVRVNQRFKQSGWYVEYGDRSSPADAYSTLAKINLLQFSSTMRRLVASAGDYFEILVQDDLTSLVGFECKVAGHEEI